MVTLRERVAEVQTRLPKGVRIVPFYQRTDLINHTVTTVVENLSLGALLVIAILLLFLRNWRLTLVAACTLPLTVVMTFFFMWMFGGTINVMSMAKSYFGAAFSINAVAQGRVRPARS